ncbi:MAG: flagellar biosynthesis protein FlhF [Burkholderiaceae bacterium]|nr:flagellar biosynthesis protein FlhF [Burkholderiaceae bacterium]
MNVKRFSAKTAREALAQVREALGEDAVVLSTKPAGDGVEVLAMAPEGMARLEQAAAQAPVLRARPSAVAPASTRPATLAERIAARGERLEPRLEPTLAGAGADPGVERDVETLGMSTLTFQDYVRERMLKRRQAELAQQGRPQDEPLVAPAAAAVARAAGPATPPLRVVAADGRHAEPPRAAPDGPPLRHAALRERINPPRREPPVLRDEIRFGAPAQRGSLDDGQAPARRLDGLGDELRSELRSVRELIDERFGTLAFMERLQRDPRQAALSQKLFEAGLSPALVRKLVQSLPADRQQAPDELAWAAGVLERNLHTDEHEPPLEDCDGVFALIGPTGVGKTTSTAKLAAAFATRHGAANLGLITLDAYRIAAHEQLRTYGRILGVPVHTAHDRASLEDLLDLLSGKKLVLIDTAGMAQRDARTRELLEMLQHRAIRKLLVLNAAAQGETVEDVMVAYGVQQCHGVIVSKLDEAVKLGPALDALIRHRAKVVGVANGQRVPEDWHRLSASSLVQRALRGGGSASWKLDAAEVNLVFAAIHGAGYPGAAAAPRGAALPA